MGVGGSVKATASFDFGTPTDNDYSFITSEIDMNQPPGNGGKWQFSARSSMLYMNLVALPESKNRIGAYINVNFQGANYAPLLQYAYIRWRGLTAGYAYTLFADQTAAVPTIDYEGPNSYTGLQATLLNFESNIDKAGRFAAGIGINSPLYSVAEFKGTATVNQRLPDIPAYVQYNFGGTGHFRVSAILRNLYYRNEITSRNVDKLGWGVKLSGVGDIADRLTGYFQALYGKGISSYYQDLAGCCMDMVATTTPGCLNPVESWGAYVGLQYSPTDRLHLSGCYSHIRLYPGRNETMPDVAAAYRYAQYVSGTATYDINSFLSAGLEYLYGRRVQADGSQRHNSRVQAALQINF